jgi:peptidoglycan/LPS O-acetylase OafA/YrhL
MTSKISYRPDIDGLRAIAVLSVVFYHAGIQIFSGGYIGVDVFFVISGYLITTIIVREIEANEFSIIKFYERRIRRIYPALYATIPFILLAAYLLYDPDNFTQTSKSIMATTVFMSNILFWTESGYFDAPSTLKPLLHTWSLAVEEQFYIVFPLLILLITRYAKKWLKFLLGALAFLSFLLSVYYLKQNASAVFYFAHLRAWELLIGGLLAVNTVPEIINTRFKSLFSLTGLALIIESLLTYTHDTPFPGASALLPTLGSALIIYSGSGGNSVVGKILSWPPFVFVGKISYSLYLWHWPIIIFGKYYLIRTPTPIQIIILIITSFAFSIFSWMVVEKPFRSKSFLQSPKIFIFAGSAMSFTLALCGMIYLEHGMPGRFNSNQSAIFANSNSVWGQEKTCDETDLKIFKEFNRCKLGQGSSEPIFLVWGDSHARALAPALDTSAQREGMTGYLATRNACPPMLGVDRLNQTDCYDFNNKIMDHIEAHPEWKTIILVGRWALSIGGERYKTEEGESVTLIDMQSATPSVSNAIIFENGIDRTVNKLLKLKRRVVIVSSVPEVGYDVPSSYFIAARTGRDVNGIIAPTFDEYLQRNSMVIDIMKKMRNRYNVQIIDPAEVLCDMSICKVVVDGQPLYKDGHHLSTFGSLYISDIFNPLFEDLSQSLITR